MSKALIITEKPSVAKDIVAALGGSKKRKKASITRATSMCVYAVGHILNLLSQKIFPRNSNAGDYKIYRLFLTSLK